MNRRFVVALFTDPTALVAAVRTLRQQRFPIYDVFAPYPIHGLDRVMGLRRTRLPLVTLLAGLVGLSFAAIFQAYTNILDWPLNVGGKPANSALAFVPVCFELTVLMGGLSTVAALLIRARLFPGKREDLPAAGVTDDRFALVLRRPADPDDLHRALTMLNEHGALQLEEREGAP